ncbi:hypothetical protein LEP1GSC047_3187 [Leptospira inadai serovar Lyme str. 10]|uniref:Uncharacterized protein n=1 Tax=Leptospira inadai serovar Lyme str. 10 TaxID=1049790 RepID=V6HCT3_9LEPT|nr:hypothetical protein LEP1GSC047_3187 [Leptospira inadai serovar Lyme str. 10]
MIEKILSAGSNATPKQQRQKEELKQSKDFSIPTIDWT